MHSALNAVDDRPFPSHVCSSPLGDTTSQLLLAPRGCHLDTKVECAQEGWTASTKLAEWRHAVWNPANIEQLVKSEGRSRVVDLTLFLGIL